MIGAIIGDIKTEHPNGVRQWARSCLAIIKETGPAMAGPVSFAPHQDCFSHAVNSSRERAPRRSHSLGEVPLKLLLQDEAEHCSVSLLF